MSKRIAIIGGGPAGITTAKSMLEQNLIPTVFEKSSEIGGVWNQNDGKTWNTMTTHLSRYFESFSDYPWPKTSRLLPKASEVTEYLHSYIERFNLKSHIKCNSKVVHVSQLEETKKWLVKWIDQIDKTKHEDEFDGLVIATGAHADPYMPDYESRDRYKGQMIHSNFYNKLKQSHNLTNKKAIVVGHSVSAAEICSDLANEGAQVLNVFKKPHWILETLLKTNPTSSSDGIPADLIVFNRKSSYPQQALSAEQLNPILNEQFSNICAEQNQHSALYIDATSMDPACAATSKNYVGSVKNGSIRPQRRTIQSFTESGVVLDDGTHEEADFIIFATGYRIIDLSFFDENILKTMDYNRNETLQPLVLYKGTIHLDLHMFAAVGVMRDTSFGIVEIQGRWASFLFSEKIKLPSREEFEAGLVREREIRSKTKAKKAFVRDFLVFPDEIAREIGALPDFDELSKSDPELYKLLWEGPWCTAQYRLNEDRKLALAVIMEIQEEIKQNS